MARIDEITEPVVKVLPAKKPKQEIRYLDISGIDNKTHCVVEAKTYFGENAPSRARQLVHSGDILFSTVRTYLKNIAQVPAEFDGQIASTGFSVLRPSSAILSDYLFVYTLTPMLLEPLAALQRGSNYPAVRDQDVRSQSIPLPPLAEQKRIVAKIEELFSELEAGEESLRVARRQLGVYRQALLKQAFEGKLTATWRTQNPDKLELPDQLLARIQSERQARYEERFANWKKYGSTGKKPSKPKGDNESLYQVFDGDKCPHSLPESWAWCLFRAVCDFANGDRGKNYPNRSEYVGEGIPWINTGHIEPDGSLSCDRMNYITRKKFESLNGGQIEPHDLVYCLRGATFGKTAFVRPYTEGAIASSLMIVRPVQPESCKYIFRYLLSPLGKSQLKRFDNGSAQPNLSAENVGLYLFPLCSLPEQKEIVRLLDEQFEEIERNEREIDEALRKSEALRQSILKKAFSGQLVPQDLLDEPASVLLERIRQTAAAASPSQPKARRGRASKTKN